MVAWLRAMLGGEGQVPSPALCAAADGVRIYAIGDVHGRADLLAEILAKIDADRRDASGKVVLVMIGDVIDRGAESKAAVALVAGAAKDFDDVVYLRGNHEQALLDFVQDPVNHPEWLGYGGDIACLSYGVAVRDQRGFARDMAAISAEIAEAMREAGHLALFENTQLTWENGDYLFVHAGVRRGVPIAHQLPHDLMFIREAFLGQPHGLGCRIVFGHTPLEEVLIADDRIGLDTGAYRTGVLSCAVIEGTSVRLLQTGTQTAREEVR